MERKKAYYWCTCLQMITPIKVRRLIEEAGGPSEVFGQSDEKLVQMGFTAREQRIYHEACAMEKTIEAEYEKLSQSGIRFVTIEDEEYPVLLKEVADRPIGLFVKGNLPKFDFPKIAIVGARACSSYGKECAEEIARELSAAGAQIVSGMAYGIDCCSQKAALEAGSSYAVLGGGVYICYPRENIDLYTRLVESGGIISEYPLGMNPLSGFFPERNRIISGLSDVVIVVEARQKSGSLITVDQALEQNKEIMAVPGRIGDPLSKGCNELIKMGAMVITCPEDIKQSSVVERWMESYVAGKKYFDDHKTQCNGDIDTIFSLDSAINSLASAKNMVYSQTNLYPKDLDTISKETGLDVTVVSQLLLDLQLQGVIREVSKNCYVRCGI